VLRLNWRELLFEEAGRIMHTMRLSFQQKSDCISMRVASNTVASCSFSGEIAEYESGKPAAYSIDRLSRNSMGGKDHVEY
jgi:hypothetical protein